MIRYHPLGTQISGRDLEMFDALLHSKSGSLKVSDFFGFGDFQV